MKLKFKLLTLFLILVSFSAMAGKGEYSRHIHRAFLKSGVTALNLQNKFGEITINDSGGDSVTIDVKIVVENAYEGKAEYLLRQINIAISKSGKTVTAETNISSDFKTKQNFSINYKVNIPANCDLDISNKYGSLSVAKLEARGKFDIAYGNITTGSMNTPDNSSVLLNLSYGKADMEDVNKLNAEIKYSKLYMDKIDYLQLDSKYSSMSIDEVGELNTTSKYDGFSIDRAGSVSAESKYTHYSIGDLQKKFILTSEYGNVDVEKVESDFEMIDITSSYGGIKLGLDDRSYNLQAECTYCGINYPQERFVGNKEKDNQNIKLDGQVGKGTGIVHIVSRYGGVKLSK